MGVLQSARTRVIEHDAMRNPPPLTETLTDVCTCGHDRFHKEVRAECQWSGLGMLAIVFAGVNARPKSVEFRCTRCRTLFMKTRDPRICEEHRSPR